MSDLVSRQQAIDAADKIIKRDTSGNNDVVKAMTAWKSYIEQLPSAEHEHNWIACSERLPNPCESKYWICTDSGYQCQCRWTNDNWGFGATDRWTWKTIDIPQYTKVVAWMALIEPYEGV